MGERHKTPVGGHWARLQEGQTLSPKSHSRHVPPHPKRLLVSPMGVRPTGRWLDVQSSGADDNLKG